MLNGDPETPGDGDGQADERPPIGPWPQMRPWVAGAIVAALFVGGMIESTRRSVRSTAATIRRWLHRT